LAVTYEASTVMQAAGTESRLGELEAHPRLSKHGTRHGHAHAVEHNFRVAARCVVKAKDVEGSDYGDTERVHRNEKDGMPPMGRVAR
jgi:hypothetical protein